MKTQILDIAKKLYYNHLTPETATDLLLSMFAVKKMYYWLKPDGEISNMWDEETHKKYLTKEDIEESEKTGWKLIQINIHSQEP